MRTLGGFRDSPLRNANARHYAGGEAEKTTAARPAVHGNETKTNDDSSKGRIKTMPRKPKATHLVDKLTEALASVKKLERKGFNRDEGYDYTRATDVFEILRGELFKRGILCIPQEGKPEYVHLGLTNGGGQLIECRLPVTYIFRDAKEVLEPIMVNGSARDLKGKALYQAQTGAQKAMCKRFGLMAEVVDDPEFESHEFNDDGAITAEVQTGATQRTPKTLTVPQIRAFQVACQENGRTDQEVTDYLFTVHNVSKLADLGRGKEFSDAIRWASAGGKQADPKSQAATRRIEHR